MYARSGIDLDTKKNNKDEWLYLEYGYCFEIEKKAKEHTSSLYALIYGRRINDEDNDLYTERNIGNSVVSDKRKCVRYLTELIVEASDKATDYTDDPRYKRALEKLGRSFGTLE